MRRRCTLEDAIGDAAVYALNTPALWSAAPRFDAKLTREYIDPRDAGNYDRYFIQNRLPVVWFGEPSVMDRRLVAQSGLFVVPGRIDQGVLMARLHGDTMGPRMPMQGVELTPSELGAVEA